ncbi:uncharacterized protein LOC134270310 [Saccostrea cucullata]|uniref:uncharacterized protein LOC134270310 n=1 Tax=Saccostrea cuccullata TaxID=36930 RepID=UPI002ED34593
MVVGHYGVGKTTLTYGLIGKDMKGIESTDGIDLFRARCRIDDSNDDTGEWCLVQDNFISPAALAAAPNTVLFDRKGKKTNFKISDETYDIFKAVTALAEEKQKHSFDNVSDPNSTTTQTSTSLLKPVYKSQKTLMHNKTNNANNVPCVRPDQSSNENEERSKYSSEFYEKSQKARTAELEDRMKDIFIDMWDFGGQNVFYTTHQSFLTSRCMYLLVINCAKDLNATLQDKSLHPTQQSESKIEDFIDFWISTITNYAKSNESGFPRIILIGTHIDEIERNPSYRVEKICAQIKEKYHRLVSNKQLIINERLFFNAKETDEEKYVALRDFILEEAKLQPHWEEPFPKSWLHLLDFIVTKREEGIDILTLKELKEFNQNSIVPIEDSSLENMLQRQHEIGDIIFFNTKLLKNIIILDPSFLIRALKCLISTEGHMKKSGWNLECWKNLSTKGVVLEDTIKSIWANNELLHKYSDVLLSVFQHMDIIVKPKSYVGGKEVHVNQQKIYLIPCMIEESDSKERVDTFLKNSEKLYKSFDVSINKELIPPAIGYRLLSFCTSMWPVVKESLFTACGFFRLDLHHILILRAFPTYIRVYVVHRRSKESISAALYNSVNITLMSFLEACLLPFHENLSVNSDFQELQDDISTPESQMHCNTDCPGIGFTCKEKTVEDVELSRLARLLTDPFQKHQLGTELGITQKEMDRIVAEHGSQNDQMFYVLYEWRKRPKPTFSYLQDALERCNIDIHNLCKVCKTNYIDTQVMQNIPKEELDKDLTDQELDQVALRIGREYFQFLLELGLPVSQIEQVMDENRDNVLRGIQKLLHIWREGSKFKPTVKMLGCALLQCDGDFNSFCELIAPTQDDDLWLPHSLFPNDGNAHI